MISRGARRRRGHRRRTPPPAPAGNRRHHAGAAHQNPKPRGGEAEKSRPLGGCLPGAQRAREPEPAGEGGPEGGPAAAQRPPRGPEGKQGRPNREATASRGPERGPKPKTPPQPGAPSTPRQGRARRAARRPRRGRRPAAARRRGPAATARRQRADGYRRRRTPAGAPRGQQGQRSSPQPDPRGPTRPRSTALCPAASPGKPPDGPPARQTISDRAERARDPAPDGGGASAASLTGEAMQGRCPPSPALFVCSFLECQSYPLIHIHTLGGSQFPVSLPCFNRDFRADSTPPPAVRFLVRFPPLLRPVNGVYDAFQFPNGGAAGYLRHRKGHHSRSNRPPLIRRQPPHKWGHFLQFCSHFLPFPPLFRHLFVGMYDLPPATEAPPSRRVPLRFGQGFAQRHPPSLPAHPARKPCTARAIPYLPREKHLLSVSVPWGSHPHEWGPTPPSLAPDFRHSSTPTLKK